MDIQNLELKARKLFGGAKIEVKPYSDGVMSALDVTIIPDLDGEKRFIRVSAIQGEPAILEYLDKIQQNLLQLQRNGAFGIRQIQDQVDQEIVNKAIEKADIRTVQPTQVKQDLESFGEPVKIPKLECEKCGYTTKYAGILGIHKRKHKEVVKEVLPVNKLAKAVNDPMIYEVK